LGVRSEVLTAVKMTILYWVVTPCRFAGRYQRLGETVAHHHRHRLFENKLLRIGLMPLKIVKI
jgi:hypothetical protein